MTEWQDDRVVKAPSILMKTDYIYPGGSWHQNPVDKNVHMEELVLKSRPVVTMAGVS
jgi:hypothetical protein